MTNQQSATNGSPRGTISIQNSLIDPRCPWVQVHEAESRDQFPGEPGPAWRLVAFKYEDETEAAGSHHIYVHLLDADGMPAGGVKVTHGWPNYEHPDETVTSPTDPEGNVNWGMWEDSIINDKHPRGPYWICPMLPADWVDGMGLPAKRHVNYRLTFRWTPGAITPPPDQPPDAVPDLWKAAYAATKQATDQSLPFTFNGEGYHVLWGMQIGMLASRDADGALFLIYPDEAKKL